MSTFGSHLRVTTFGESHGKAVGCVVDGLPGGLQVRLQEIQNVMDRRRPGQSILTTSRNETDSVDLYSGVSWLSDDTAVTLGTPVMLMVHNQDFRTGDYVCQEAPRPGHADLTYLIKFGVGAKSGGGRSSARETVGRVAAGALSTVLLRQAAPSMRIVSFAVEVYNIRVPEDVIAQWRENPPTPEEVDVLSVVYAIETDGNVTFTLDKPTTGDFATVCTRCPHPETSLNMARVIWRARQEGDTLGGVTMCVVTGVPEALGEPVFDKLPALLAHGIMSLPAAKGFEIGEGFHGARNMTGYQHNDP